MKHLGIYPRWETESQLLSQLEREWDAWVRDKWGPDCQNLEAYACGENPFPDNLRVDGLRRWSTRVSASMGGCGGHEGARAMRILFSSGDKTGWGPLLAKHWGYEFWRVRIEQYGEADSARPYGRPSLNHALESLSACLCAGWLEQARSLTEEIKVLYERRRFFDSGYYPLYHWLLRVCFDHWNLPFDAWGRLDEEKPQALSEPVLNELFEHWRDVDLAPMQNHLIWLCDYYTHRTRRKDWYEFSNSHLLTRFPALILAWQRLREIRGLKNPTIDHPLMQPAYARLQPALPFYTADVLDAALARLRREEMPGLGQLRQPPTAKKSEKLDCLRACLEELNLYNYFN